jgi:KaiC/GvpD/RAD55 family RecA-like ATPase
MSEQDRLRNISEVLDAHRKRLHILRVQAAEQGIHAPPHVVNEVREIEQQIKALEFQIAEAEGGPSELGPLNEYESRVSKIELLLNHLSRELRSYEKSKGREQFQLYRTNVSQAFWYLPASVEEGRPFAPARLTPPQAHGSGARATFAWFDELLRDGLYLPSEGRRPLTMVVAGPPGSGKTSLVLEMCYRLARNELGNAEPLCSLYISLDQDTDRLITNAERFGYDYVRQFILDYDAERDAHMPKRGGHVSVYGRDQIASQNARSGRRPQSSKLLQQIVSGAKKDLEERLKNNHPSGFSPDIVVLDSLNLVPGADKVDLFHEFHEITSAGSKLVIFVIDSATGGSGYAIWEYACDFVVRLDYTTQNDYYIRTIEVVKARYQSHVWGKHQLKVYEKPQLPMFQDPHLHAKLRRYHPYRKEGGIFIYPSIHYYLSLYKRRSLNANVTYAQTKPFLKDVLENGIPEGRCTAFIGTRGGHKSHFGYLHLLHRIIERRPQKEAALIISLRDDEDMTAKTLDNIIETEFNSGASRKQLEEENKLEILYFHPGYITPEEFFHRVFISVKRLVKDGSKLTVLFNSVDQLASRFPLCAKENIFIPGIIEFLTGEGATSIFIAVDEPGQPAEQYGLLPMADLILSFYPHRVKYEEYREMLKLAHLINDTDRESMEVITRMNEKYGEEGFIEAIVLQVVRFAGGEQAGARGILELIKEDDNGLYKAGGLHFTPIGPKIQPQPIVYSHFRAQISQ